MTLELLDLKANLSPRMESRTITRDSEAVVLGRLGTLETRLAVSRREVEAAQTIRYRVFVEEMGAELPSEAMRIRRDFDAFDDICDHLIVLDTAIDGDSADQIVATYRILRQDVAIPASIRRPNSISPR